MYTIPRSSPEPPLLRLWNVTAPAGTRMFRNHCHIQFEIVLFKEGQGIYSTKGHDYTIRENDIFIFHSNEIHCITRIDQGHNLTLMNLHFEPRYLWGVSFDSLSADHANLCFSRDDRFPNRLPRNHPVTAQIRALLLKIEQELTKQPAEYQLMVKSRLNEILVLLIRELQYNAAAQGTSVGKHSIDAIRRAMRYIDDNLHADLSLSAIAETAQMSPTYFSAVFKQVNNITLWHYINHKRVELAMHAIDGNPEAKMIDVAVSCGFNNTANFNKMFKKYTGITPSFYKKYGHIAFYVE